MTDEPELNSAYALGSMDETKALYAAWAESYDRDFCDAQGYQTPRELVRTFAERGGTGPVLDVGAGTGVVGQGVVASGVGPVDALDLSAEMLEVARRKDIYRDLIEADVTRPLPVSGYRGIVSAGTFTLGHVGPEGLPPLLEAGEPGCLYVISVNAKHNVEAGFEAFFAEIETDIAGFQSREFRFYDDRADEDHRYDTGLMISFVKR